MRRHEAVRNPGRTVGWPAAAVLAVWLGWGVAPLPAQEIPTASTITPAQAAAMIETRAGDSAFIILDVRTPEEFAAGHIKNALNHDVKAPDFAEKIAKLNPAATYLIYCRAGVRSLRALGIMAEKGFTRLYNLDGGIQRWQAENFPIVTDG